MLHRRTSVGHAGADDVEMGLWTLGQCSLRQDGTVDAMTLVMTSV